MTFPHPKGYVCYQGTPVLSGKMDDSAWANAPWTDVFVDIEGDVRPAPTWETRVKMLWDEEYFYVGAKLTEPHIWATLTEHDSVIFHDNDFEVFIDPDADNHQYYEYEINALGTDWDLRLVKPYRDGGPALNEWEIPGLKRAVHVEGTLNDPNDEDSWWGVEIAFPWSVLQEFNTRKRGSGSRPPVPLPLEHYRGFAPDPGDQWRVNFSRVEWDVVVEGGKYVKVPGRPEHNWVWSPQYAIDMHRPELWGYVQFSHMPPGTDAFHPDAAWETRCRLMDVYWAQKAFFEKEKRWGFMAEVGAFDGIEFISSPSGWTAKIGNFSIRQDSLFTDHTRAK